MKPSEKRLNSTKILFHTVYTLGVRCALNYPYDFLQTVNVTSKQRENPHFLFLSKASPLILKHELHLLTLLKNKVVVL